MKLHPRVTRSAVELVKRFEGLRRRAARLPDGGWTIGYGHTRSAREGAVVGPEDADALLYYDLSEVAEKVEAWTFTPLNQNQFEALTAFAFNIGTENFRRSTVLKRVNEGQHLMAAAAFELWRKADFGGEDLVVDALVRRRAAEKAHYLTPPEGFKPSPTPVLKPTFDHSVIEAAAYSRAARPAAIVDAPLDGDMATATLQAAPEADVADVKQAAFPFLAASTAGLATARLHHLFPEKVIEPAAAPEPQAPPFVLEEETPEHAAPDAVNDTRFAAGRGQDPSPLSIPAPAAPFSGFAPPPVRRYEATTSLESAEAFAGAPASTQSQEPAEPLADQRTSLFDAPSARSFTGFEGERNAFPGLGVDPAFDGERDDPGAFDEVSGLERPRPGVLHDRSLIYFSIGLLGVALFAAALFSMFSGKASPVNLVIGLMGILFMTPAGGFFLLKFLNKREESAEAQTS